MNQVQQPLPPAYQSTPDDHPKPRMRSASGDSWLLFAEAGPALCQAPLHGSGARPHADTVVVVVHMDDPPWAQYTCSDCLQMLRGSHDEEMLSG
jgi:hypothetical protein